MYKIQHRKMPSYHIFSTEADVTMPTLPEEQRHNATGRQKAGTTRVILPDIWGFGCDTSTQEAFVTYQGQTTQAQDQYIRLMHLRDRFRTTTSTASRIPGLRRISSQTVINRLRQAGLQARRPVRRNMSVNDFSGVDNIFHVHVRSEEQVSFPMNLADGRSKSIDVIMNVMPPIVFWNMSVPVMVVSCVGRGVQRYQIKARMGSPTVT